MDGDSNRREFLRNASLAGVALVAGGGALAVPGCCGGEKAELEKLRVENAKLQNVARTAQASEVEIDPHGNLLILDEGLKARL